jgi:hypothetical protein
MMQSARLRYLLLALMVAASHVVLVSHVAAHFQADLEQCELCVSQAQPLAAIPVAENPPAAEYLPSAALPPSSRGAPVHAVDRSQRQRAPPAPSS